MRAASLSPRDGASSTATFVDLISDPFSTSLDQKSFWSSLGWSVCFAVIFAALFCFLRPYNSAVYAPRLKAADDRHKPPLTNKGFLGWVDPVLKTREQLLVDKIGLDATLFLRFTKMCRNMFLALAFVGCGAFIPINIIVNSGNSGSKASAFMRLTPLNLSGSVCWVHVLVSYVFDVIICFFVWTNYKAVKSLRQDYFNSPEYQDSLHSRTLMLTDVPKPMRSAEGIVTLTEKIKTTDPRPTGVIARNVKELPELIEQYTTTVLELEDVVTKYCRNPKKLPAKRPTIKPYKNDTDYPDRQKLDAIEYLSTRLNKLRSEIEHVRESVDQRDPLPYGFASYETIQEAHSVAYAVKRKHPQGATVRLAPKPTDIIWKNLPLSKNDRRWRGLINFGWYLLLTLAWNVPNGLIAIFVANLSNLGQVWPAFQTELNKDPTLWAIIQGVLAPLLLTTFYMLLPTVFRRISIKAGDYSKTGRERHVIAKLYFFFTFNNLFVYSLFGAVWKYVATVEQASKTEDTLTALETADIFGNSMTALCQVSTYWLNYLVSRNLGAAYDISQLSSLAWGSFQRKFVSSPTPRKIAQSTAPPLFDYASYFNYFLFYVTVALVFAPFQPLVLLVALAYFTLDSYLKKYLLLYVFSTRHESGGLYWRVIINRLLISTFLSNVVMALLVTAKGGNWGPMLATMAPIPLLLLGYKLYLTKYFDVPIKFYNQGPRKRISRLGGQEEGTTSERIHKPTSLRQRFGHPALSDELMTIMVPAAVKELLPQLYGHRNTHDDGWTRDNYNGVYDNGANNTYSLTDFSSRPGRVGPGKQSRFNTAAVDGAAPFEFIDDDAMSFTNFKNRPEFRDEFGGDGEMYGRPSDLSRPGTPGTFVSRSGNGTPANGFRGAGVGVGVGAGFAGADRMGSMDSERTVTEAGAEYPAGYHAPPTQGLVAGAAPMGRGTPELRSGSARGSPERGAGRSRGGGGGGGGGYVRVETPDEEDEFLGYDYFRRGGGRG